MNWRREGKKSIHVWLPIDLVEKIKAENDKVNKGHWYKTETIQATYERIINSFFESSPIKKKGK